MISLSLFKQLQGLLLEFTIMSFKASVYAHPEIGKLFESDTLLPERYYSALRKSYHGDPERRLLAAILEDVVARLSIDPRYATSRQRRDFRDAKHWLNAPDDNEWVFSFRNICEALGIDSSYLRGGLNRWISTIGDRINHAPRIRPNLAGVRHKQFRLRA